MPCLATSFNVEPQARTSVAATDHSAEYTPPRATARLTCRDALILACGSTLNTAHRFASGQGGLRRSAEPASSLRRHLADEFQGQRKDDVADRFVLKGRLGHFDQAAHLSAGKRQRIDAVQL